MRSFAWSRPLSVRNQARVHLWFEANVGEPYAPLSCTAKSRASGNGMVEIGEVGLPTEQVRGLNAHGKTRTNASH
jgi:hypothetical protein